MLSTWNLYWYSSSSSDLKVPINYQRFAFPAYIRFVFWLVQWMPAFILIGQDGYFGWLFGTHLKIPLFLYQMLIKSPSLYTIGPVFFHCHLYCNFENCTSTSRTCRSKNEAGAKNILNILYKNSQVKVTIQSEISYILVNSRPVLNLLKKNIG